MSEIYCLDKNGKKIYNLYQWDVGQQLIISTSGLNIDTFSGAVVHFCNKESELAYSVNATYTGGKLYADIPNELLRVPLTILAYIYVGDGTSNKTVYAIKIPVRPRTQPSDYVYVDNIKVVSIDTILAQVQEVLSTVTNSEEAIETLLTNASIKMEELEELQNNIQRDLDDKISKTADWQIIDDNVEFNSNIVAVGVEIEAAGLYGIGIDTISGGTENSKQLITSGAVYEKTKELTDSIEQISIDSELLGSAMQPSVYDKLGKKTDIFEYAQARADLVQTNLDAVQKNNNEAHEGIIADVEAIEDEISAAHSFDGLETSESLADTLSYAVEKAVDTSKDYTKSALQDYRAFTFKILESGESLPTYGESQVFYLIPNASGSGYDKYWWITDQEGNSKWDALGSATTIVVDALPEVGDSNTDYILRSEAGCLYYKYIDGEWQIIAGSIAKVYSVDEALPENGNELTDYYKKNENGTYSHYRYIDGEYCVIGGDTYTKDELDLIIAEMNSKINVISGKVDAASAAVDALGVLVSDVTEADTGISVYYADGTSKTVDTKDTTVKVEDVNRSESGLTIVYTDGDSKEIEISGGSGGTSSGSASITRITASSTQCVYKDECLIEYEFSALDSAGDTVGDGVATWYVGNVKKATSTAYQGYNSFDIGPYLSVGSNNVKLSISVDTGGETNTVTTKTWTVNAVNMYAVWDYDDTTVNEADTIAIRWTPYGDLSKTTHIIIDGEEVYSGDTTRSGVQQYVTLNKLSHGSHLAELYLTATINGTTIQSESIYHDMIFADSGNTTPIIGCSVASATITQYNTLSLPIVIYNPVSLTADATLAVDGVTAATWTNVDRTIHYWNYTPSDFGEKVLTITCGETVKTINVIVEELDIDNEEIAGYAFRFKASDIAGNDALRAWNSNGVSMAFSDNFDWSNGGIKTETDDDGNLRQFMCIKAGTTATIGYELFGNDARASGKNFKIIFKAVNCRDADAQILDCMYGNVGLNIYVNKAVAQSGTTDTFETQFAEDSYIEYEYEIYPSSGYPYLKSWIDGVMSNVNTYVSDSANFTQTTKKQIVIGSDDCDVYVYMVKAYETYLTNDNHIENFIADAPNAQEMVDRYNRNDILNESGEISYEKLAEQNPELYVGLWDIERMTDGKKDYVYDCSFSLMVTALGAEYQVTAEGVTIAIQGTSSVGYKDSAANTDSSFTQGFTDGNGNHLDTYAFTENSIGVDYMNVKVNVASCENVNNLVLADWYNTYDPYKTAYRYKNPKARDCMELHMGVQFIKDRSGGLFADTDDYHLYSIMNIGNSKKNLEVFHDSENELECCVETLDNDSNFCMMLDPNFSLEDLESEEYFEFRYPTKPTDTHKQAFLRLALWFANGNPANATGEALAESVTYGAYTFKGFTPVDADDYDGEQVLAGTTISAYAGTYTHDTYEYRMAKMLNECEDYLIMDQVVFHHLFITQFTMIDNCTKNTFWHTEDCVHWSLAKDYDNDTAFGNDNNGLLIVPTGCEEFDQLTDARAVFNGNQNVYFGFIYGLPDARRTMWLNRETAGCWNSEALIAKAKAEQDKVPERVWNAAYQRLYLRLYEDNNNSAYLPKLEGGKKQHQRKAFITDNHYYFGSRYRGTVCTSQKVVFRGYTPTEWAGVEPKSQVSIALRKKGYIVVEVGNRIQSVKTEKGVYQTITFDDGSMNDTVINLDGANLIQGIKDIPGLYIGYCDFSGAAYVRTLEIGSAAEGYKNNNLTSIDFGANTMLEELYVQNCPNATSVLNLSQLQALKDIDVRGSGFTGVTFATGGVVESALLCSPTTLTMISLQALTDENLSFENYDKLSTLRLEDCPYIDSLNLVTLAVNLERLRLLGIDWTLTETTLLNNLLKIIGMDENGLNTDISVLTGDVYVSGLIRDMEIKSYAAAWSNLNVTYDSGNKITQFEVVFANDDGTVLYSEYVDQGAYATDPVGAGYIDEPTKKATAQEEYTYAGWTSEINSVILRDTTIYATYTSSTRSYTVRWFLQQGGSAVKSETVAYGSEVIYDGDVPASATTASDGTITFSYPEYPEHPAKENNEANYIYSLFKGWDKSTGFVTEDIDVYAIWETANIPTAGKELSDMNFTEVYGIGQWFKKDSTNNLPSKYFELKDYIDFNLGQDFSFSNVEETVIVEDDVIKATGEEAYFDGSTFYNTGLSLFGENESDFTIVIDYEFANTSGDTTLMSSGFATDGYKGFRLRYNGGAYIQWGDKSQKVGYSQHRDLCVLRHRKGETRLYVYAFNGGVTENIYGDSITYSELLRTTDYTTDGNIVLGGWMVNENGVDYGQSLAKGFIHFMKIWYADLGDNICRKLAAWTHEKWRYEYCGEKKYHLAGSSVNTCSMSFLANNLSPLLHSMNATSTNSGGWAVTGLRNFLGTRFFNALPITLQQAIKAVKIYSSIGDQSYSVTASEDKIYLYNPTELGNETASPYVDEIGYASGAGYISYLTSNASRIKFNSRIIPDDAQYITSSTDPMLITTYQSTIKEGDIWTTDGNGYMYLSQETIDKYNITPRYSGANGNGTTKGSEDYDGGWVEAGDYWMRSPRISASTHFMAVYRSGIVTYNNGAKNTNSLNPGFSI